MAVWNIHIGLAAWSNHTFALGEDCSNVGNAYRCIIAGTSTAAPTGTTADIAPGGVAHFKWLSAIDYTSLQTWADTNYDAVTADSDVLFWNHGVIQCAAGTPLLYLAPPTLPNSFKIRFKPAPGEGLSDKANIPLAYDAANGVAIQLPTGTDTDIPYFVIDAHNITFEGIQFKNPRQGGLSTPLTCSGNNLTLRKCLFDVYGRATGSNVEISGSGPLIDSCLLLDRHTTDPQNLLGLWPGTVKIVNSLFIATAAPGVAQAIFINDTVAAGRVIRNSGIFGWASSEPIWADAANIITADHCITDSPNLGDITIDGGANLVSRALTNQVRNTATDFRLKSGADAIGAGVVDTDSPQGFFGNLRGTTADIGPDEFVSPSASVVISGAVATATAHAPTLIRGTARSITGAAATASAHAGTLVISQQQPVGEFTSEFTREFSVGFIPIRGTARAWGSANPQWFIGSLPPPGLAVAGVVARPRGSAGIATFLSFGTAVLRGRAIARGFTAGFGASGTPAQSGHASGVPRGQVTAQTIAAVQATGRSPSPRGTTSLLSVIAASGHAMIRARAGGTVRTSPGLLGTARPRGTVSRVPAATVVLSGVLGRPRGRILASMHIPVQAHGRAIARSSATSTYLAQQIPVIGAPPPLTIWQRLSSVTPTQEMRIKPRLMRMSFGDGYGQTVPDGMTLVVRTMTLTWNNIDKIECDQIIQFFTNSLGVPISFVAPRENSPRKWLAIDWHRTSPQPDADSLTVTFEDRPFYEPIPGL